MKVKYKLKVDKGEISSFFNGISKVVREFSKGIKNSVGQFPPIDMPYPYPNGTGNQVGIGSDVDVDNLDKYPDMPEHVKDEIRKRNSEKVNRKKNIVVGLDGSKTTVKDSEPKHLVEDTSVTKQKRQDTLFGRSLFLELARIWCKNFDIEGAPQPDRFSHISSAFNQHSKEIFMYMRSVGGLTESVRDVYAELINVDLDSVQNSNELRIPFLTNTRLIAENMCQVASQLVPELYEMLEYDKSKRTEKIGSKYFQCFIVSDNTVVDNNPSNLVVEVPQDQDYMNPSYLNPSWSR